MSGNIYHVKNIYLLERIPSLFLLQYHNVEENLD